MLEIVALQFFTSNNTQEIVVLKKLSLRIRWKS